MRVGIIGAGLIGQAVARLAIAAGHAAMLSNSRGAESLAALARAIGCAAGSVEQAAAFAELAVIAIPLKHYRTIPAAPLAGKIVLDANNYFPERDGRIAVLDQRQATTSGMLQEHLSGSKVVKAFNAILEKHLEADGRPPGTPGRRALPIAGDDAAAKQGAARLIDEFGFDVVDAGGLAESWRFERAKPAFCFPFDSTGLRRALAAAERAVDIEEGSWRR